MRIKEFSAVPDDERFTPLRSLALFWSDQLSPPTGHPLGTTTLFDRVWIRNKTDLFLVPFPADGKSRDITLSAMIAMENVGAALCFGEGKRIPTRIAWAFRIGGVPEGEILAELFDALDPETGQPIDADGDGIVDAMKVREHSQATGVASLAGAVIPSASGKADIGGILVSNVPYIVNDAAAEWVTVDPTPITFGNDIEYEIPGGTPAGSYDFRAVKSTAYNPKLGDPTSGLTLTVFALRWTPVAGTPAAGDAKFAVQRFAFTLTSNPDLIPPDFPTGGQLLDLNTTPVVAKVDKNQDVRDKVVGIRYFEDTDQLVWALRRVCNGESGFDYKYNATIRTFRQAVPEQDSGGRYTFVEKIPWTVTGLRVYTNGAITYDDLPSGVLAAVRVNESVFPSDGGYLDTSSPAKTKTFRGFADATGATRGNEGLVARSRLHALVHPRRGGNFWAVTSVVPVQDPATAPLQKAVWRLVDQTQEFTLSNVNRGNSFHFVQISQAGSLIWVFKCDDASQDGDFGVSPGGPTDPFPTAGGTLRSQDGWLVSIVDDGTGQIDFSDALIAGMPHFSGGFVTFASVENVAEHASAEGELPAEELIPRVILSWHEGGGEGPANASDPPPEEGSLHEPESPTSVVKMSRRSRALDLDDIDDEWDGNGSKRWAVGKYPMHRWQFVPADAKTPEGGN